MSVFDKIQNNRDKKRSELIEQHEKRLNKCRAVDNMVRSVLKELKKSQSGWKDQDFTFFDGIRFDSETFGNYRWILGGKFNPIEVSVTAKFSKKDEIEEFDVQRLNRSWSDYSDAKLICARDRKDLEKAILIVYGK